MRLFYLTALLSLIVGCSKSDGGGNSGGSGDEQNYTLSLLSYEGLDESGEFEDDFLLCDGTAGVSYSVDTDSGQPLRATLLTADADAPSMVIEFDESGQPSLITIGRNYIALGNYSGSNVDISCVNSEGETLSLRSVPTSIDWDAQAMSVATRYDFIEGLTNDFKTIGIGVAYGLMSVGELYTVIVDKDYSLEGLADKGEAIVGIASNLSKAIITALPEAENIVFLADLAKDDDQDEILSSLGDLSDLLSDDEGVSGSDLVSSFLVSVSGKVGEYLLYKVTDKDTIDDAYDKVGEGEIIDGEVTEEENPGTSFMRIYFDMAPGTFYSLKFWEPGGAYKYDSELGVYRNVGRIEYYVNGAYTSSDEPCYNSSQYGAVVTYGDTWVQIYYEEAPNGSYGGNFMLVNCYTYNLPSGHNTQCTMTVTIANDEKSYSTTADNTTIIPTFRYADGEFTYFQEE